MPKVSAFIPAYNCIEFIPYLLESLEPIVDQIVIVEGSWQDGGYSYGANLRSSDGTRAVCNEFAEKYPSKVKVFNSILDESTSFNLGVSYCDNDWVLLCAADEFYHIKDLLRAFDYIDRTPEVEALLFPEYTFYFNFRRYMKGSRMRLVNMKSREFFMANGTGDNIRPWPSIVANFPCIMHHYQWVGDRAKVMESNNIEKERKHYGREYERVVLREDGTNRPGTWKWWLEDIYGKFDGTEETEKRLLEEARGSFHPWAYQNEEFRNFELCEVQDGFQHPRAIQKAPYFDMECRGKVKFNVSG